MPSCSVSSVMSSGSLERSSSVGRKVRFLVMVSPLTVSDDSSTRPPYTETPETLPACVPIGTHSFSSSPWHVAER